MRILITGGAGSLAADIIPPLVGYGHAVTAVDSSPVAERTRRAAADQVFDSGGSLRTVETDLFSLDNQSQLFAEADTVIHLAGIPLEDEWPQILKTNIDLTERVLRRAQDFGVARVIYASSIHATGFTPIPPMGTLLSPDIPANPNTYYGTSKAAGEALCRYFSNTTTIRILNVRICSRFLYPQDERMLSTWLSPRDAAELFHVGCTSPLPRAYWSIWGVSANKRTWFDTNPGELLGFRPLDNAETYADSVPPNPQHHAQTSAGATIGGQFSSSNPPRMKG